MRFVNLQKFYCLFAVILLTTQCVGLVFCGDIECLQGSSDEACAALICGLLGKHASTAPASNDTQKNSCQCYCHLLADLPKITLAIAPLKITPFHFSEALLLVSAPVHDIDHPPLV